MILSAKKDVIYCANSFKKLVVAKFFTFIRFNKIADIGNFDVFFRSDKKFFAVYICFYTRRVIKFL